MSHRDIIVIGASAGGLEALQQVIGNLPANLQAAVLVVLHTSSHSGSMLPRILGRAGKLPAVHPYDGQRIEHGKVYIAPPSFHMIVEDGSLRVVQGPRENLHRPAIDPLFRSAAAAYGPRTIGVILTGMLDDGTAGLMVVAASGGEAIVQEPESAMYPSMPRSAVENVPSAKVAPLFDIPSLLVELVRAPLPAERARIPAPASAVKETRIAKVDMDEISDEARVGQPSSFACPDCGGVLWQVEQDGFLRFRCRVGHALTAQYLGMQQRQVVETALWEGLRALEESASLYRRMASRAMASRHDLTGRIYEDRAQNTEANARILREFLLRVNVEQNNNVTDVLHSFEQSPAAEPA